MAILNIRNLDDADAARIRRAAQARGMTLAQYIVATNLLHRVALDGIPDGGILMNTGQLEALGLGPVTA